MNIHPGFRGRDVAVVLAVVAVFAVLAVARPAAVAGAPEPCCFANDRYEGTCTVVPGEGESCGSILAYLNNPMSTGKSYCGSTQVRGGWAQVNCKTGKSATQGTVGTVGTATAPRAAAPPRAAASGR